MEHAPQTNLPADDSGDSQSRYRRLFERNLAGAFVTTPECSIVDCNDAFARMFGYESHDELVGVNGIGLYADPADRQPYLDRLMADGVVRDYELAMRHTSGKRIWVLISSYLVQSEEVGDFRVEGTIIDITARREAEHAFAQAEQHGIDRYERLLERLGTLAEALDTARALQSVYRALRDFAFASTKASGIFVALYDPQRMVRYAVYSAGADEEDDVSGFPALPITTSPPSRAIVEGATVIVDDYQTFVRAEKQYIVGSETDPDLPQSSLTVPMSAMGSIVGTVELQSTQLAAFGPEHATAVRMAAGLAAIAIENVRVRDRDARLQEELRQSQKMEAVGRLAGGIAHDFNNLLTVITGYAEIAGRTVASTDPIHNPIREIRYAATRAAALTRQLLAFSRKQVLQPKVLDLSSVVGGIERMLGRLIGEDISLKTDLEPNLAKILADPGQIEQVVLNLVVNARDAMPSGGNLTIRTSNVENADGRFAQLQVSDSGTGMSVQTQEHIFEPFFTTKDPGKGTGLGLSTVYGIVAQSGGMITVESQLGSGTSFLISFPEVDGSLSDSETSDSKIDVEHRAGTILLVEDEAPVRRFVEDVLASQGYRVLSAENATQALAIVRDTSDTIHLLLTDVVMPDINGRELADRLVLDRPGIRVLFMSGYTEDVMSDRGVLFEGLTLLEKPFSATELLTVVHRVLAH